MFGRDVQLSKYTLHLTSTINCAWLSYSFKGQDQWILMQQL